MIKPDESFDWDSAVGKAFYSSRLSWVFENKEPEGFVVRVTGQRVYYRPYRPEVYGNSEQYCRKATVSFIADGDDDILAMAAAYTARKRAIEAARVAYDEFITGLCERRAQGEKINAKG